MTSRFLTVAVCLIAAVCLPALSAPAADDAKPAASPVAGADAAGAKIKVLILSGANNHDWKTTTPALQKIYEDSGRFTVDVENDITHVTPDTFAKYDVIVGNWTKYPQLTGSRWPAETEKAFLDYLSSGKGFVLFHAASTAWGDWPEFTKLIGLSWVKGKSGHAKNFSYKVAVQDGEHPVTGGMKDFQHVAEELYHGQKMAEGTRVLCTAHDDKAQGGSGLDEPVIVVTQYGKGRVFHNTMGHNVAAMKCVGWTTLMLRGTEWAATGKVTIPIPANWPQPKEAGTP